MELKSINLAEFVEWSPQESVTAPTSWRNTYPEAEFRVITSENYQEL